MEKIGDKIRAFPFLALGLALLAGLLIGWLAIGWWLWPVRWINADPWDLRVEYQKRYVALIAKEHAQSRDADQAREALKGWDGEALADLLAAMQYQARDSEIHRQLADLASVLELPQAGVAAPTEPEPHSVPPLRRRLVTVLGTAGIALAVVVLVILAISTRTWESATELKKRTLREQAEVPAPISEHFVSIYTQDQGKYDDYFSIEAPDGRFLGECGLSIGRILGQERPRRVTALEMVLFDSPDHRTETRILMSRYAHEDAVLRQELEIRGELVLAEPGAEVLIETNNLQMLATIEELRYADQRPAEGVFQRVVIDLNVRIKHLPTERLEGRS
ncbi:MAG: hypothetical protein U9Q78_02765 [Chloroflexota bacterium]|nr:hypothetical protein [Chloroflexota bacterium]